MDHFAGLDVSVKETNVCILDDAGKIVKEVKVASEPQALLKVLGNPTYRKTDRNDARGIAQMMRVGMYRPVHVKTLRSQKLRMLLTHRKLFSPRPSPSRTICEGLCVTSVSRWAWSERRG